MSTVTSMESPGIGPRKTLFIMVTVVGCIAFLWPKVFYPMMFGGGGAGPAKNLIKDHRGSGCCDVVLDQEESFGNSSLGYSDKTFRKTIMIVGDDVISIRQERPPHLRPDSIHPAMRERGRNIPPSSHIIPIVERPPVPPVQPRVVEGRPGPIPGMRPPMGAGSVHQAQPKASTMGFLMPMYTIAIVSFFVYTIMKLVFKKPQSLSPYNAAHIPSDPHFHKQVFTQETAGYKRPDDGTTKIVVTAIQGLIDAADEQFKRKENATNSSKESKETSNGISPSSSSSISNGHATTIDGAVAQPIENGHIKYSGEPSDSISKKTTDFIESEKHDITKPHETGTVRILGLELTATREDGHKWSQQQMTPSSSNKQTNSLSKNLLNFNVAKNKPNTLEQIPFEPKPIYLEGALPHESQILVSDSEISAENVLLHDDEDDDSDEPAVVLSSKMTLSLISLDPPSSDDIKPSIDDQVENKTFENGIVKDVSTEKGETATEEIEEEVEEDEPVVDKIVIEEDEEYEEYEEDEEEQDDHVQKDDIKK